MMPLSAQSRSAAVTDAAGIRVMSGMPVLLSSGWSLGCRSISAINFVLRRSSDHYGSNLTTSGRIKVETGNVGVLSRYQHIAVILSAWLPAHSPGFLS